MKRARVVTGSLTLREFDPRLNNKHVLCKPGHVKSRSEHRVFGDRGGVHT